METRALSKGRTYSHTDLVIANTVCIPSVCLPSDSLRPTQCFDHLFTVGFPDRSEFPTFLNKPGDSPLSCYTDGSGRNSMFGAGFCISQRNRLLTTQFCPLGSWSTVFQTEVFAISSCALWLLSKDLEPQRIYFYTDSQAALRALVKPIITSSTVFERVRNLNQLGRWHHVHLSWIPGHSGLSGNELADKLANFGSASTPFGPQPLLPVPISVVNMAIKNWVETNSLALWSKRPTCRQTKLAIPEPSLARRKTLLRLPRADIRLVLMLATGHGTLARHRFIQKQHPSPTCSFCMEEDETPEHFICSCPKWSSARAKYLWHSIPFAEAFSPSNIPGLIKFIKETERLNPANPLVGNCSHLLGMQVQA